MVSWSIYETIFIKHPHLQILRYKQPPQGPDSRPRYMESLPDMARHYVYVYIFVYIYIYVYSPSIYATIAISVSTSLR